MRGPELPVSTSSLLQARTLLEGIGPAEERLTPGNPSAEQHALTDVALANAELPLDALSCDALSPALQSAALRSQFGKIARAKFPGRAVRSWGALDAELFLLLG